MKQELLDDELPIEEVDQFYLNFLRQALPVLRLTAFAIMAYGGISFLQVLIYWAMQGEFLSVSNSYFSSFLWILSDVIITLVGYKLWQKYQELKELDKQGFEESQLIWMHHSKHIWQLLALVELINVVDWFI